MRRLIFRTLAVLLGIASIWAICAGAMNQMPLLKRVMSFGLAVVFLLYGLAGDKPAEYLAGLLFGFPSRTNKSCTDSDDADPQSDR